MAASTLALSQTVPETSKQSVGSNPAHSRCIVFDDDEELSPQPDNDDQHIDLFNKVVAQTNAKDALDFWRVNEGRFPALALLAKKYLSVQASSADTERMFSIAGHVFSLRRRCLGVLFFAALVWLKLNEAFFND